MNTNKTNLFLSIFLTILIIYINTQTTINIDERYFYFKGKNGNCIGTDTSHKIIEKNCYKEDPSTYWTSKYNNDWNPIFTNYESETMEKNQNNNSIFGFNENGSPGQVWKIEYVNNEQFIQFKEYYTNYCLSSSNLGIGSGYILAICDKNDDKQFFIFDNIWFRIAKRNLCMSAPELENPIYQQYCEKTDNMLWRKIQVGNNFLFLSKSGKVLDSGLAGNLILKGMNRRADNELNQHWTIENTSDKYQFGFQSVSQKGKCIWNEDMESQPYYIQDCDLSKEAEWFSIYT